MTTLAHPPRILLQRTEIVIEDKPVPVRPFLKWVGGKGQIVDIISNNLPSNGYHRYFEPFLGGGAVFFKLISPDKEAFLSDINKDLIRAYSDIRDNVDDVINDYMDIVHEFSIPSRQWRRTRYKNLRLRYNDLPIDNNCTYKTALLIFLNRTCYNGVYRENSSGKFNVPYGRPNLATLGNTKHIREVSGKLQGKVINNLPFSDALSQAAKGDLVYLDPPYVPLTKTANFTKYHSTDFSMEQHQSLATLFSELSERGCYVMLSNSLTDEVKTLYEKYLDKMVIIDANRNINCKGNLRKPVKEVLIKNY